MNINLSKPCTDKSKPCTDNLSALYSSQTSNKIQPSHIDELGAGFSDTGVTQLSWTKLSADLISLCLIGPANA